ncbi:hypothetical protein HYW53_02975 [Candidatus Giovannonibacteria bacterium]|nr:hypothetical protein [Candidatus Giovannonibacteria bacterium]
MNYRGVVIEESLENKDVLKKMSILDTKVEAVTEAHHTPHLKQWTLHTFEIPENKAEEIAEKICQSLEDAWYADFKNEKYHFIIYRGKKFRVDLGNPEVYKKAKEYGLSLGIPEYQLDFGPEDKIWKR